MSQDLLCPLAKGRVKTHPRSKCLYQAYIHYGDRVLVEGYGYKYVNDAMNQRHRNRIDLWVATYDEEKAVGVQKNRSVYVF